MKSDAARAAAPARAVELVSVPGGRTEVRVRAEHGPWVVLHDGVDPLADARAQVDGLAGAAPAAVVVVGAGLGYLTEAAASRWPTAAVVVMEPLPALAAAARQRTPGLYTSTRIHVLAGPDYAGVGDLWRVFDRGDAVTPPTILADPVLARAVPGLITEAARAVGRAVSAAQMNARARADNAGRYVVQTLRNLRHVVAGPDPAALRGRFNGVPAVVVGAGPSLDHDVAALRGLADRALIIAADTAWRPLVGAGVPPHLVVALDPTTENGRHLVDMPPSADTWLVAEGSIEPEALAPHDGRVATFRVGAHHPWPWLHGLGVDRLLLRAWGSVLTSAFDLALVCGCDPVVFVGADLGFTGEQPYCRGTTHERIWARHTARGVSLREVWRNSLHARELLDESGVTGESVPTAPHLIEFRNWIAARAAETTAGRVVNASAGGILLGAGIRRASLADVLASRPACDAFVRETLEATLGGHDTSPPTDAVVAALAPIARAGAPAPPVPDWIAFGRPTLTHDAIQSAAAAGRAALSTAPPVGRTPATGTAVPTLRWYEADRVAAARARLTSDRSGLEGVRPPSAPARGDAVAAARHGIERLLVLSEVATAFGADVIDGASPTLVPLSARFAWTAEAAPLVAHLEEATLDACGGATPPPPRSPQEYWDGPIVPVVVAPEHPAAPGAAIDRAARAALLAERLALGDDTVASHRLDPRQRRLTSAAARALADPTLVAPDGHGVTLPLDGASLHLPIAVDALMRAVTGTIVPAVATDEPRTAFLVAGAAQLEPIVLTARGLPHGWTVAPGADDRAVFVPALADHSVRLASDGAVETGEAWPGPITSEASWGHDGGALAWNAIDHVAYWRRHRGDAGGSTAVPFKPMHLALSRDDVPYWTDAANHVWQWTPGEAASLIASLPMSGIPRFEGDVLLVAPTPRDPAARVARQRLAYEWRVDCATGHWTAIDAGPEGPCAKAATRGAWSATSHPAADLVRLQRAGRDPLWLACQAPLGVAWAGASLVVLAGGMSVLLFPELLDRLEAWPAGASLALPGLARAAGPRAAESTETAPRPAAGTLDAAVGATTCSHRS